MSGLNFVLAWLHSRKCRLSKNGRSVSVAIAWNMGRKTGTVAALDTLSKETALGRTATMTAITEACGPRGIFDRQKRGPGRANRYDIRKTAGNPVVMTAGNPTLKTDGKQGVMTGGRLPDIRTQKRTSTSTGRNAEPAQASGSDRTEPVRGADLAAQMRRVQSIEDRMRRIA